MSLKERILSYKGGMNMKKKIVLLSTIAFAGLTGAAASTIHASDDFKVSIVRDDTKVYRKANLTKHLR